MPSSVTWNETDDDNRREQAASDARRQRSAGAGAAPRHRHAGSPAVLRYAGAELRRAGAASSRLGQVGAAAMAAQRARHRRDAQLAAGRSRPERRVAGGARLRRLDRRRDGEPGADRVPQAGAGRRDGHQAARGLYRRPGDRVLSRLSAGRLPRSGGVHARLWRCIDGSARAVGHLPRDGVPHRVEAVHVQPDAAASAGRREDAGAGGVGRR